MWQHPMRLDNARLVEPLGAEPHTPLAAAVHTTLAEIGCLPDAATPRVPAFATASGKRGLA